MTNSARLKVRLARHTTHFFLAVLIILVSQTFGVWAFAFPPYKSTDAETADPGTVEARLGFLDWTRENRQDSYSLPLTRVNLGLPRNLEFVTEFEYRSGQGRVGNAAAGLKWVPFSGSWSFGAESLALLPVSSVGGAGIEGTLLATYHEHNFFFHLNAGGFTDNRHDEAESGWKVGALAEAVWGRFRPGLELFAKQVEFQPVQVLVTPGVIVDFGHFDLSIGVRLGVTDAAPDYGGNFWISFKAPLF